MLKCYFQMEAAPVVGDQAPGRPPERWPTTRCGARSVRAAFYRDFYEGGYLTAEEADVGT